MCTISGMYEKYKKNVYGVVYNTTADSEPPQNPSSELTTCNSHNPTPNEQT
jgi:hypothetical protein